MSVGKHRDSRDPTTSVLTVIVFVFCLILMWVGLLTFRSIRDNPVPVQDPSGWVDVSYSLPV